MQILELEKNTKLKYMLKFCLIKIKEKKFYIKYYINKKIKELKNK